MEHFSQQEPDLQKKQISFYKYNAQNLKQDNEDNLYILPNLEITLSRQFVNPDLAIKVPAMYPLVRSIQDNSILNSDISKETQLAMNLSNSYSRQKNKTFLNSCKITKNKQEIKEQQLYEKNTQRNILFYPVQNIKKEIQQTIIKQNGENQFKNGDTQMIRRQEIVYNIQEEIQQTIIDQNRKNLFKNEDTKTQRKQYPINNKKDEVQQVIMNQKRENLIYDAQIQRRQDTVYHIKEEISQIMMKEQNIKEEVQYKIINSKRVNPFKNDNTLMQRKQDHVYDIKEELQQARINQKRSNLFQNDNNIQRKHDTIHKEIQETKTNPNGETQTKNDDTLIQRRYPINNVKEEVQQTIMNLNRENPNDDFQIQRRQKNDQDFIASSNSHKSKKYLKFEKKQQKSLRQFDQNQTNNNNEQQISNKKVQFLKQCENQFKQNQIPIPIQRNDQFRSNTEYYQNQQIYIQENNRDIIKEQKEQQCNKQQQQQQQIICQLQDIKQDNKNIIIIFKKQNSEQIEDCQFNNNHNLIDQSITNLSQFNIYQPSLGSNSHQGCCQRCQLQYIQYDNANNLQNNHQTLPTFTDDSSLLALNNSDNNKQQHFDLTSLDSNHHIIHQQQNQISFQPHMQRPQYIYQNFRDYEQFNYVPYLIQPQQYIIYQDYQE